MSPLLRVLDRIDLRVCLQGVPVVSAPTRPLRGGHLLQAAPEPTTPGAHATGAATQTPKKDQTIDPVETWESHHLSRCPEEPGQDMGGPAAAAETQPCSTDEARSAVTGRAALRASHLPTSSINEDARAAAGTSARA